MAIIVMRVSVNFQDERLDLEVPDDRVIADWRGPSGLSIPDFRQRLLEALETPRDYPALRLAVVPGDHVLIALDDEVPEVKTVLEVTCRILQEAGVEPEGITVLVPPEAKPRLVSAMPEGIALVAHDRDDRAGLAYLASTADGRRVYLNRLLTDADFVLPIGRLGYDRALGYRGPWSTLSPGLSDAEAIERYRAQVNDAIPKPDRPSPGLTESAEVSWLLGSQFHLGVVAGASGAVEVVAGLESSVREQGARAVDAAWRFLAPARADLVVVGIGRPGQATDLDRLAVGLATATRLVQRGGKIVALSRAEGVIGPALQRLIEVGDPRTGPSALRGREAAPDYPAALQLARALAWADVYLLSALDREVAEDLSMIVLDRAEEARRLVTSSPSCLFVSFADQVQADVADES